MAGAVPVKRFWHKYGLAFLRSDYTRGCVFALLAPITVLRVFREIMCHVNVDLLFFSALTIYDKSMIRNHKIFGSKSVPVSKH